MSNPLKLSVPEGVPYIDVEREFDFPVEAVFEAHRDPAMIANWLGPRGMKAEIDHYDFRTGGSYRYTHVSPDGERYDFSGVFHTVRDNEFAIQTFEFLGYPDVVSIEFLTFEDLGGGRCKLVGHSVYPSQEARDGMAQSGMEGGMTEGYERLDELLASLPSRA
ncbi:SRPBCC family protein [Arthrobacter parietis]|uniref:SRPBCC family protein n=2 Tax=Arthrobacter TaxID=1663 RepID=A0ABT6CWK2_9MICC|nr:MULTISPECIES: SRPBCC family protein [Arthrobacter]KRF08772.1 polyketide cyclase [Arthrobacter sp. Soil782]MDF9278466.1 SRPBCC family protein [Arthrobacter vasquezii]